MFSAPRDPVPVFPLPNLVLFPHTQAGLHVFELRYRTMVRDALSGGRVIGVALLKPGWEIEYEGSPEFHALGCLAGFEDVEWLPNDCYQLVVKGLARVRFRRIVKEFPYRAAHIEILPQEPYTEDDPLIQSERQAISEALARVARDVTLRGSGPTPGREPGVQETAGPAPGAGLAGAGEPADPFAGASYECIVNALCASLDADPHEKLELLQLDSVIERGRHALELSRRRPRPRRAPPDTGEAGERN